MKDLKLDPTGDLLISGFDLVLVDGRDQVGQRLKTRLKTFLGEWFLDIDRGVPYFEDVLVKNPDMARVNAVLTQQILLDSEITSVTSFATSFDGTTRRLRYDIVVDTVFGTLFLTDNLEVV